MKLFNLHTLTMNKLCLAGLAVAALVSSCGDDITTQSDSPKEPTASTEVSTIADANTTLLSKDNVTITGEISGNATILIPAATGSTSKTTKTVRMEKIANSADIEVKEADGTTKSTANGIVVSMPNLASDNKVDLTITTPNSTVTIQGNDGLTTFKKLKIAAKNTIITDGVTIYKELEIREGNVGYVRINKGATVTKFDPEVQTIVYYEKGANLPSEVYENVTMIESK